MNLRGFQALESGKEEIALLIEMAEEEGDASLIPEIESEFEAFTERLETLRLATLFIG